MDYLIFERKIVGESEEVCIVGRLFTGDYVAYRRDSSFTIKRSYFLSHAWGEEEENKNYQTM